MRFYSAVSDLSSSTDAAARAIAEAREAMKERIDVVFLFLTAHHLEFADAILEKVWLELDPQVIVGCSAGGVIGGELEIEQGPGLALLAGEMPNVRLHPFHIAGRSDWEEIISDPAALAERIGHGPQTRAVIGFGDPLSTPIGQLLTAMDKAAAGSPLVGGLASSGRMAGENRLFRNDRILDDGFVGLSIGGAVSVQTLVSQGCRPIGRPLVITKAHDNVIEQLGGRPAVKVLRDIVEEMSEDERELLGEGLFIGQAISEYRERFGRGDFLVRNVIGMDEEEGSIGVADYVRPGRTAQFHVRDADTASEDLMLLLENQRSQQVPPAGGLLFSCNGRGTRMFDQPCHDIHAARDALPDTPLAGFFAAGELGPVGEKNFLHGHTASFALFRPDAD